jgi:AcrR family transcriptional regulator
MAITSQQTHPNESSLPTIPSNENTERIFEEAWVMFQQLGYRGTSVDELCQRCGITKPTLYYYFGNKETLFIQVLARQLHGFRSILDAGRPLVERLTELTQAMLTAFKTDIGSMMRDMEHVKDPSLHASMDQSFRRELFDPLMRTMQDGIERGELRLNDSEFYAWIFLGLVNTFVRSRSRPAHPGFVNDPQLLAPRLVDFFFEGAYHPMQREE